MDIKKKLVSLVLSGVAVFSIAGCENWDTSVATGDTAIIWSALSTEKYLRDEVPASYTEAKLDYVGMKGETTAMQVMITAKEYIKSFDLEVSDLKSEDGTVFSKDNFAVYAERYVEVYNPYAHSAIKGPSKIGQAGYYPDALVPIDRYITNREARVEKGNNQGIWVDCVIPADAAAGSYSGTFTLSYGEETEEIPVTLYVYNVTMPEEVHSRTFIGLWYDCLAGGEGDMYTSETNQIYYDYMASKRLATDDVPPAYTKNVSTFIEYILKVAENPKVTSYLFPSNSLGIDKQALSPSPENAHKYTQAQQDAEADKLEDKLVNILEEILKTNLILREEGNEDIDMLKKLAFAIEDEPMSDYRLKLVRILGERMTAAKRRVAEMYADDFEEHPDLLESMNRIVQTCPSNKVDASLSVSSKNWSFQEYEPDYEKGDGLTFWCPEQYKWKDASFRQLVREKQALGERFIWYNCCSTSPVMSYYVDAIPVSIRMYSWMQYEYGVEGILYWSAVYWNSVVGGDPYEDVSHTNGWGAGEGVLLYPGLKYGLKTPISSIRFEQMFHGQQDYEYFYLLDGYLVANGINVKASDIIVPLLTNLRDGGYTKETATGADLEISRVKVLDLLQDFANGNVDSAKAKINQILG